MATTCNHLAYIIKTRQNNPAEDIGIFRTIMLGAISWHVHLMLLGMTVRKCGDVCFE